MLKRIRVSTNIKNGNVLNSGKILSFHELKTLIEYEKSRSQRSGGCFSLVIFYTAKIPAKYPKSFYKELFHVIRSVDCVGRDESGRISIFLPDTDKTGCQVFVEKIVGKLPVSITASLEVAVFQYPETISAAEKSEFPDFKEEPPASQDYKPPVFSDITGIPFCALPKIIGMPQLKTSKFFRTDSSQGPLRTG